ncbi:MAG: hypothetical protein LC798_03095 [Chloroflexi bacterium]|nr:hypothetical protein [Chloroflexota bacterium]
MPGLDPDEVLVTGFGGVYEAPVGTAFPANIDTAIPAAFKEVGYITEDGARFSFGRDVNEIMAWQSRDPIRQVVTAVPKTVSFDIQQWNIRTVKLALGGGVVTEEAAGGAYRYDPPDEDFIDERAFIIVGEDGDIDYRFCFRRATNQAGVDFAFVRNDPAALPIELKVLAAGGGLKSYFVQSNDPALGPADVPFVP